MSILDVLRWVVIIFFRLDFALVLMKMENVPFWQAYLIIATRNALTTTATYYGINLAFKGISVLVKKIYQLLNLCLSDLPLYDIFNSLRLRITQFRENYQKGMLNWIIRRRVLILIILAFIPFTQYIPFFFTALIVVFKFSRVRYGLPILITGNSFRWFILAYLIYQI